MDQYSGVVELGGGIRVMESARVAWKDDIRPVFVLPPDSVYQPVAQPVRLTLEAAEAVTEVVYIYGLRFTAC